MLFIVVKQFLMIRRVVSIIVTMSGGVGSGKTISAVRQAIVEAEKNPVLTNFKIFKLKNYYRLKKGDVLVEKRNEKGKLEG